MRWLTGQPAWGESLSSTWVPGGSEGRSRWWREPIASSGCSTPMGGPALSPALPCLGRRGAQARCVFVLTTGRQPAPLPTTTTPGVKGSTQSKQETVRSTATNESAASGPIIWHAIPSSVTRVPQRWTRVTLSGVAEAQEASPVTSQHPFLETAVTHIPCNQQSRRRSGVERERTGRKERSC